MHTDHDKLRRTLLMGTLGLWGAGAALAQSSGTVLKVVVGSPPGALGDIVARLVAEQMSAQLGTSAIVDNKAGAAGLIAANVVAKSSGDGTTLLVAPDNVMVVNPLIYPHIPYNAQRDFAPIGILGKADLVLLANAQSGIRSMEDLIRVARAKPDSITYSSGGVGHVTHLGVELIAARLGFKLRHVPYKGTSPAMAAVVGGEANLMYSGAAGALPQIKSGRVIALAASGPRAKETFPGVPLLADFNPDLDITVWFGLFAPSKTPPEVVAKLNAALNAFLEKPEVVKRLTDLGMTADPGSPEALAKLMTSDTARFAGLVKSLNISVE
jgi:tripartite-type tricarboxylate transporter receptor subunit TctC